MNFSSYGLAGKSAQEALSSLRTVLSFGSMEKEIKRYDASLQDAEKVSTKKGKLL
jgi:hypothetical protein